MVSIDEADCDILQFIWVDDASKDSPNMRVYRFTRVVFGVSSSPFLLNATIRFHLEKYLETKESLVQHLLCSTYEDDVISSKEIFCEGGSNLRKFLTNSTSLQKRIDFKEIPKPNDSPQQDKPTFSEATLGVSQSSKLEEHKVLGVPWNPESDQVNFDITNLRS